MDAAIPFYHDLVDHYERCLKMHGVTPKGVDWPNIDDTSTRFAVMLDVCKIKNHNNAIQLLDLGCGYGALLDYINASSYRNKIQYKGIDLSSKMIEAACQRYDAKYFEARDILINKLAPASYDYIIMNGLFTEKRNLTQVQMENFFAQMISQAFIACRHSIVFNVMSFHVDWCREDLFHLPFDRMAAIVIEHCSRHFLIRADYGLYEYTVYVNRQVSL